jgi:hypothetical protein
MKASGVSLMDAIVAQNKTMLLKMDTQQAFLNDDIGDGKFYIRPPDWSPSSLVAWAGTHLLPKGHVLLMMKSMYGTRQSARQWFPDEWKCANIMLSTMRK